ncbi:MAG: hypothetical protein B6243_03565 [Anaerolineaceae bacterium 4572_5.2]|nr:MAG: hypothetical protein B6243_03565 [Anaerolineaceae bacterium 4572_5.2]
MVTSATRKRKKVELPVAQFIAIIVLSIALFLIVDFGRRTASGYRIYREEARLKAQLAPLEKTHQLLLTQQAYAQTDAYVEEIARHELKWSKPGEVVVVVLATPQAGYPPLSASNSAGAFPSTDTPFSAWFNLFFAEQTVER